MKFLISSLLATLAASADICPHDKEVECITDVNNGI